MQPSGVRQKTPGQRHNPESKRMLTVNGGGAGLPKGSPGQAGFSLPSRTVSSIAALSSGVGHPRTQPPALVQVACDVFGVERGSSSARCHVHGVPHVEPLPHVYHPAAPPTLGRQHHPFPRVPGPLHGLTRAVILGHGERLTPGHGAFPSPGIIWVGGMVGSATPPTGGVARYRYTTLGGGLAGHTTPTPHEVGHVGICTTAPTSAVGTGRGGTCGPPRGRWCSYVLPV